MIETQKRNDDDLAYMTKKNLAKTSGVNLDKNEEDNLSIIINNEYNTNIDDHDENEKGRDSMPTLMQSFVMRPEESKESPDRSMPLPERILNDADAKQIRQDELILFMGSPIYKHICNKMSMKTRTLIDNSDPGDLVIKDDSVNIQLR